MAYCPHCAFMMPSKGKKVSCPNCGRKKLKLRSKKPSVYTESSAFEYREDVRGTFFSSLAFTIMIALCSLVFFAMGIVMRGPVGLLFSCFGILGSIVSTYCFRHWSRNFTVDRKPVKGYIDYLSDLEASRISLRSKIDQLKQLHERQRPRESERAANRHKLLSAALKNRALKLQLLNEASFIIEAKKRISRIEALAQDLSTKKDQPEVEKHIEKSFKEIKTWMANLDIDCHSVAGMKAYHSLEQAMELHSDILEQIEDRVVLRAIDDKAENGEAFALEKIYEFLERSSLQSDLEEFEIEEAIAADEEYIKINTELRLLKDAVNESIDYPSGLS